VAVPTTKPLRAEATARARARASSANTFGQRYSEINASIIVAAGCAKINLPLWSTLMLEFDSY
jgi:hypothetical protein